MFQEFGFSSNLPLIVITIVVVALTILCYIESKRVSSEFDNIREKINDLAKKLNRVNSALLLKDPDENITFDDHKPESTPENIVVPSPPQDNSKTDNSEKDNRKPKPNQPNQPQRVEIRGGPPLPHPLLAMMMGGPPPEMMMGGPPMGMMPDVSQKIEEWDDNMDEPKEIKKFDEEIIDEMLEDQEMEEDDDIQSDREDSDEDDDDNDEEDEEDDDDEDDGDDENTIQEINPDTKVISLVDSGYSVKQLQDICKEKGLSISGNKTQLVNRINSH